MKEETNKTTLGNLRIESEVALSKTWNTSNTKHLMFLSANTLKNSLPPHAKHNKDIIVVKGTQQKITDDNFFVTKQTKVIIL